MKLTKNEWAAVIIGIIIVIVIIVLAVHSSSGQPAEATSQTATTTASTTNQTATSTSMKDTATVGSTVNVTYTGKLSDGTVFDSTDLHGGQPFSFVLGTGQVIKGWDDGVLGMKVGDTKHLVIAPADGYGAAGIKGSNGSYVIPPNATLYFDVTLLSVH